MDKKKLEKIAGVENLIPLSENKKLAQSFWVTFGSESGVVEGKIHLPHKQKDKLVIFEPGFPGDGSKRLEKKWLRGLLQNGYTVFAIRHVGTIVNTAHSHTYINCAPRELRAKKGKRRVLGAKRNHTIQDWLKEPKVALDVLAPNYKNIFLAGHSFGPLAVFSSLIDFTKEKPILAKRVRRLVSLSGTLGVARSKKDIILVQWAEYLNKKWSRDRVLIGGTPNNIAVLYGAYKKIHKKAHLIPKETEFIAVHAWGDEEGSIDELVPVNESLEMLTTLGRGYLILDTGERAEAKKGYMAHDMNNLGAENFTKLLDPNWLPRRVITTLGEK